MMLKYLFYAKSDILRSKTKNFVFLIQIMVVILILNISFSLIMQWNDFNNKINQLEKNIEVTNYTEDVDSDEFINAELEAYDDFYDYVMHVTEGKAFSFISSEIEINNLNVSRNFVVRTEEDNKLYSVLYISKYMQEYYEWQCKNGRIFIESDYQENEEYIPIILGYDFCKYYNINDIIDNKYLVVGILEKDEFYLNPRWQGKVYYLNKSIILPMTYEITGWGGGFLNQLNVITTNQKVLDGIIDKSEALGLQNVEFRQMIDQLSYIHDEIYSRLRIYLGIAIILLVMCIISEVSTLLHMIERRKKEFVIHIMCGASRKDINVRICMQVIIILLLSSILSCNIYTEIIYWLLTLISVVLIAIIVLAIPLYRLHKQSISEILKRKE